MKKNWQYYKCDGMFVMSCQEKLSNQQEKLTRYRNIQMNSNNFF